MMKVGVVTQTELVSDIHNMKMDISFFTLNN